MNTEVGTSKTTRREIRTRKSNARTPAGRVLWYTANDKDIWEHTTAHVRSIRARQVRRRYNLAIYQNLYCNTGNFWGGSLFRTGSGMGKSDYQRLNANVIKSCVDTASARIAKDKPRVFVLPNNGDSRLIKKSDNLTKFCDGAFAAGKVYEAFEEAFRDAGIYGDGYVLFRERHGQIMAEPLKVDEVVVDEVNGMVNRPSEIHWQHPTPRAELCAKYPKFKDKIEQAKNMWRGDMAFMSDCDMVQTTYSWRMPSSDGADDGRWCVAIEGATLESGEYKKTYLPILRWQWTVPTYGPFGIGIAEEIEGMQRAVNEMFRNIMRGFHLFSVPRVWVEKMAQVSSKTITNDISVNMYTGEKPIFEIPPAASPDAYQFLQWVIDYCYKQLGLSQLTAQSEKPAGLNSGIGLRNYQDIETQRFAIVGQRWERLHVEAAQVLIDMSSDLYKKKGKLAVNVPGRGFVEKIDWSDANMRDDQYDLQAFPTSLLPRTPEGQLQSIQELISSGFMPQDVALGQLRIPNLNAWIEEQTASRDNIQMCLSRIRDKKKYCAPNGIADIDMCVKLAMSAWLRADLDDQTEPVVSEMLLRFLNESLAKQAAKNTPPPSATPPSAAVGQAPTPPPAPMAPQGAGAIQAAA